VGGGGMDEEEGGRRREGRETSREWFVGMFSS